MRVTPQGANENIPMIRSTPRIHQALPCLLLAVWGLGTAQAQESSSRPGVVDLAGDWHLRITAGGDSDGSDDDGRVVSLPALGSTLGVKAGDGTLWLERELQLGDGWQQRIAPSGLGILISESASGQYRLSAGGEPVGSWATPLPGIVKATDRIFEVPAAAIGPAGHLRLELQWQWREPTTARSPGWQTEVGAGWLLGDLNRLEAAAELRRLRHLNSDLPLLILALLYAAIGGYHLQLFRRDRRCREYLWFGLTAIIVAFHTLLFTHWATVLSTVHPALSRLYLATGAMMAASSIQFLWPFLARPIGRWLRGYQGSLLAVAGLALAVPESLWAPWAETVCRSWGIPFLLAAAMALARELRRGNDEARTIGIGGFAIIGVGLVEIGSQLLGRGSVFPLSAYAFAVFAVSMVFLLSNRFSRVHDDLDRLRQQLEDMVEDRTEELSTANKRLRSEISERELAQEAMRMLERAVEQSIDGIMVADLEENSLFVNEAWARLHGRESFEIFGRRLDLFHSAEQLEQVRPALQQVREEGSWEGEIAHQGKDGAAFPTWTSITLLRDPEAEPVGFVMVARDISEHKQATEEKQRIETRIQEAEKLRSLADLAGGIAHDYNNLLTGVFGNSSLALQELPTGSQASDKVTQIGAAAERAAELTAQLLAYAGAETLVLQRTDLDRLLVESRGDLIRAAGNHADLEFELAGELPAIEIDAAQVRHAVVNLIAHAAAGAPAAGSAVITLATGKVTADREYLASGYLEEELPPGDYVCLRVSDNPAGRASGATAGRASGATAGRASGAAGGGISTDRQRIFDPFAATQGAVRGLGLATVLSTVRVHHGTVKVSSSSEGGSTFELLFPATGEKAAAAPDVVRPRHKWRGSGTVLVVDDEYIMREVSRNILEQTGFEVLATGEGKEALELYRQHMASIRLILVDRTMPTMPGEEVLERILSLNPEARIVLMSGYRSDSTVRELIDKGMAEFLPKPFRPEELVEKVRSVIAPQETQA